MASRLPSSTRIARSPPQPVGRGADLFVESVHALLLVVEGDDERDRSIQGTLLTIIGPRGWVTGSGSFCQIRMAASYFGFAGLTLGSAFALPRWYW